MKFLRKLFKSMQDKNGNKIHYGDRCIVNGSLGIITGLHESKVSVLVLSEKHCAERLFDAENIEITLQ